MEKYYELYHVYENENQDDVIKFIGIFHSPKEAWLINRALNSTPKNVFGSVRLI